MVGAIRPRSEANQPLNVIVGLAGDPALELLNSRATPSPGSEGTRSWGGSAVRSREPEFIAPFGSG